MISTSTAEMVKIFVLNLQLLVPNQLVIIIDPIPRVAVFFLFFCIFFMLLIYYQIKTCIRLVNYDPGLLY